MRLERYRVEFVASLVSLTVLDVFRMADSPSTSVSLVCK